LTTLLSRRIAGGYVVRVLPIETLDLHVGRHAEEPIDPGNGRDAVVPQVLGSQDVDLLAREMLGVPLQLERVHAARKVEWVVADRVGDSDFETKPQANVPGRPIMRATRFVPVFVSVLLCASVPTSGAETSLLWRSSFDRDGHVERAAASAAVPGGSSIVVTGSSRLPGRRADF
jgi:hypothetical protein